MKPGELVVIIMLVLAGAWLLSKVLGLIWEIIGGPVSCAFWYFFEVRYPEGVNDFEDEGELLGVGMLPITERGGGSGAGFDRAVLPQQNQVKPELVLNFDAVIGFIAKHNMSDEEAIKYLAVARRLNGDHLLSANKIRDVVGGSDAVVKLQVAALRPKKEQPKPATSIRRPADGW